MSRRPKNRPDEEWITAVKPADVLFGRGSGPNDHEGNVRFRSLVAERKSEYLSTTHRQTKASIAREIVDTVWNEGGRFLKRVDGGVDAWCVVDEETTMEKAKQALRQNREKGGTTTTCPPSTSPSSAAAPAKTTMDKTEAPPPVVPPKATVTPEPSAEYPSGGGGQQQPLPHPAIAIVPPKEVVSHDGTNGVPSQLAAAAAMGGFSSSGLLDPYEPIPVDQIPQQPQRMPSGFDEWFAAHGSSVASSTGDYPYGGPPGTLERRTSETRRESLQISDLARTDPLQPDDPLQHPESSAVMEDLVDGVLRLSTRTMEEGEGGNDDSNTTMGTVERPLTIGGRGMSNSTNSTKTSNMSGVSVESDSSLLEAAKLVTGPLPTSPPNSEKHTLVADWGATAAMRQGEVGVADRRRSSKGLQGSEASLQLSEIWRRESLMNNRPLEKEDAIQEEEGDENNGADLDASPRRVSLMDRDPDNMSYLGSSSMSVIKTAMARSGDSTMTFSKGQLSDLVDDLQGDL